MPPSTPDEFPEILQTPEESLSESISGVINGQLRNTLGNTNRVLPNWESFEEFERRVKSNPLKRGAEGDSKMTAELEQSLFQSKEKLEYEEQTRVLNSMPPNQGRREQQYIEHARKFKRTTMTPLEIVHSEVPICVDSILNRRLLEIVHTVRVPEILGDGQQKQLVLTCTKCGMQIPHHFAYFCNGHLWCANHVPDLTICIACGQLRAGCKEVITYDDRSVMACDSCLKRRTRCQGCDRSINNTYIERGQCPTCMDSRNDIGPTRGFSHNTKWVGKKDGDIMKSKRVFSCEIEGMTFDNNWPNVLYKSLPKEVGISEDGSLRNNEGLHGFELQTPKLAGAKGEELVKHMTTSVKNIDAIVNELCGMHVHLDGAGIIGPNRREYPTQLLQLWRTYIVFEDVIMSFLPFSRRRNDYCRPMSEAFKVNDLDIIESLAEAERFWYKERTYPEIQAAKGTHYHSSRYFGANFHSLLAHGHFEIRFHSGTLNANKILQWANLHALIMDSAAEGKMDVDFFREAQATYRISEKTDLLFEKIGLAQNSRQYYRSRQNKFHDKKNEDEETKKSKRTSVQSSPTVSEVARFDLQRMISLTDNAPTGDMWPPLTPPQLERMRRAILETPTSFDDEDEDEDVQR